MTHFLQPADLDIPAIHNVAAFTLLEVMVALIILSMSMVVLLDSQSSSVIRTWEARRLSQAIGLARMKMLDIEYELRKDGFEAHEFEEEQCSDFRDDDLEGLDDFTYCVLIETVEFPDITLMQQNVMGMLQSFGAATGGDESSLMSGPLGDIISQFLPEGFDDEELKEQAMEQLQQTLMPQVTMGMTMIEGLLKSAVRKVTVTVKWSVRGRERQFDLVAYFTDPSTLDRGFSMPSIPAGALGGGAKP